MSHPLFPSGPWVGFYNYRNGTSRFLMDLQLTFREGRVYGDGADGLGLFGIEGIYDLEAKTCSWLKQYEATAGGHAVPYRGFREGKGIWGTWDLAQTRGGFQIWPVGRTEEVDQIKTRVEQLITEPTPT